MLRKTEKMKSSNRTASVHEMFINLNNSTLEKKVMILRFSKKFSIFQAFIFTVDLISACKNLYL